MSREREQQLHSITSPSVGDALGATKDLSGTRDLGGPSSQDVTTTLSEGLSLIDRFYNGGNRAKPEALDIIVVVLDQVVRRMREQYSRHKSEAAELRDKCRVIDETIARIRPLQVQPRPYCSIRHQRPHGTPCARRRRSRWN
jgi:hypothetical protein